MLVLSRKRNEKIVIADCITVVIVDIRGDKVRLGIEVPKDMSVHRREVWDAIQREAATEQSAVSSQQAEGTLGVSTPPLYERPHGPLGLAAGGRTVISTL